MILVRRKRTADITEHISGSLGECLKMGLHIRKQEIEIPALMIMRNHSPRARESQRIGRSVTRDAVGCTQRDAAEVNKRRLAYGVQTEVRAALDCDIAVLLLRPTVEVGGWD